MLVAKVPDLQSRPMSTVARCSTRLSNRQRFAPPYSLAGHEEHLPPRPPQGGHLLTAIVRFHRPATPNYVGLMQKSLYGLKQVSWAWNQRFNIYIYNIGFTTSNGPSLTQFCLSTKTEIVSHTYSLSITITSFSQHLLVIYSNSSRHVSTRSSP